MYSIFISHAWGYSEHYSKIVKWLNEAGFEWRNYSVPQDDPFHVKSNNGLRNSLTEQIRHCNIVIILSGMYATHSDWIDYEINEAVRMGKYIIGVEPWGQQRVPLKIQQNANIMVGWNAESVRKAVRNSRWA